jgi:hypothetical protein
VYKFIVADVAFFDQLDKVHGLAGMIMLIVSGGEETSENLARIETGDVAATCSSKVLECDPGRT